MLEADAGEALERCRHFAADVAVLDSAPLVGELKGDPDAYETAVVLVESPLDIEAAVAGLRQGVQDYLVERASDGEVVARVEAAGRTKELQHELVEQGRRLEALLHEDALTGLANRRSILTQLRGLISGARRHERPLAIAIIDIDHFKSVNDQYGHLAGDEVLIAVVGALRGHLRAEDQLGRLGGEEFLVLLPDTGSEAALTATEKLRAEVERTEMFVPVTVSAGVAALEPDERPEQLMARADAALYAAKEAGRNRVQLADATLLRRT